MMDKLELDLTVTRSQKSLLVEWGRKVAAGEWRCGDLIGSDLALSERFGVSRTVVRGALEYLSVRNIVSRKPRRGMVLERGFYVEGPRAMPKAAKILFLRWNDDAFIFDLFSGMGREAARYGVNLEQGAADGREEMLLTLLNEVPAWGDRIILLPPETPRVAKALTDAVGRGVKIVQLDRYIEGVAAPSVVFDNYAAGSLATRHLLEEHHQPVYFFGCNNPVSCRKRCQGWEDAMREAGFGDPKEFLVPSPDDSAVELIAAGDFFGECRKLLREFLKERAGEKLSIFCVHDMWANLVYEVAAGMNLAIGRDLFVVGVDDLELCRRLTPPLSSIAVPREEMGREAVRIMMEENFRRIGFCKVLPVELKKRQSSYRISNS